MKRPVLRVVLAASLALTMAGLTLWPNALPAAAAGISLDRSFAAPGDAFTVNGSGFTASDNVVVAITVQQGTATHQYATVTQASTSGTFSATLTVPGGTAAGTYPVTALDFHNHSAQATIHIVPLTYMKVGAAPGNVFVQAGHSFFARGTGFKAGETIRLTATYPEYSGNSITTNKAVAADAAGNLPEVGLYVPNDAQPGAYTLTAAGASTGAKAYSKVHVYYRPTLTADASARPGGSATVSGIDFVPGSAVTVSANIVRTDGTSATISRQGFTNGSGAFTASIPLPSDTRPGKYGVSAVDAVGHFSASTSIEVAVHPVIAVKPYSVLPGAGTTITGGGFGSGVTVTISAVFPLRTGGSRTVYAVATTNGGGAFSTVLYVPEAAGSGKVGLTAKSSAGSTTGQIFVQSPPAPVPTPTATATPAPAPQVTPTSTPIPPPHKKGHLGFQYVSIWYHTVRQGTYDHLDIQSTIHKTLGIWVMVYFPNGIHYAYYQNTDSNGFWGKSFAVPKTAISPNSDQAVITIKLWRGKKSAQHNATFTIVP